MLIDFVVAVNLSDWDDRVRLVGADTAGIWELPVLGVVEAAAVLVRPDGYVAWVADRFGDVAHRAPTRSFGVPATAAP